jgi:sec-independent protein translocase protein TatC
MLGRRVDKQRIASDEPMTLQEHLTELRGRLIKIVAAIGGGMVGGLLLAEHVQGYFLALLGHAAPGTIVYAGSPPERVTVFFTIALYIGIAFAMPVILYQLLRFVAPGLTAGERRLVYFLLPGVLVCFAGGIAFTVTVTLPEMFHVMLNFGNPEIENFQRASEVLNFCANLCLWTGLAFELPMVMFLLATLNVAPYRQLRRGRKYAAVGLMVVAAIMTPSPEALSMLIVWAPLYFLFEVGLILARFARPRPQVSVFVLLGSALAASHLMRRTRLRNAAVL